MQGRVPVTIFHLKGDLDGNTYEQLQSKADEVFQAGTRYLILDLSQVPFISSAGIRGLHYVFNLLRTDSVLESDQAISKGLRDGTFKSPHLKLLSPNQNVGNLLKVTGYDMFLEVHYNSDDAVKSF
jgi:ABC-type transporter Mla MlaB component